MQLICSSELWLHFSKNPPHSNTSVQACLQIKSDIVV